MRDTRRGVRKTRYLASIASYVWATPAGTNTVLPAFTSAVRSAKRKRSVPSRTCHASSSDRGMCSFAGPLPRHSRIANDCPVAEHLAAASGDGVESVEMIASGILDDVGASRRVWQACQRWHSTWADTVSKRDHGAPPYVYPWHSPSPQDIHAFAHAIPHTVRWRRDSSAHGVPGQLSD